MKSFKGPARKFQESQWALCSWNYIIFWYEFKVLEGRELCKTHNKPFRAGPDLEGMGLQSNTWLTIYFVVITCHDLICCPINPSGCFLSS